MGISCNLQTGQEKIKQENAKMLSCTIETINLNLEYDVAVIDEI